MQKKINITAGKKNLISDVEGIKVGNAENIKLNTGLTFLKLNSSHKFTFTRDRHVFMVFKLGATC